MFLPSQSDPCTKRQVPQESQTPNPPCKTTLTPIERPFIASQARSRLRTVQDPLSDILEDQLEAEGPGDQREPIFTAEDTPTYH